MPGTELDHRALAAALESRILDGAGKTPPALRREASVVVGQLSASR